MNCPICLSLHEIKIYSTLPTGHFNECLNCDYMFFSSFNQKKTETSKLEAYQDLYWLEEISAAKERAFGISIARASEVFILSSIPIKTFLDIGTGPGYFLDAVNKYLPDSSITFLGVEKFPPGSEFQTKNPGFRTGWLEQFKDESIDGGICIEVIEHLSATEVLQLFNLLYVKSSKGATYIFNTGLTDYVRKEDSDYLDPEIRGHISIWSIRALKILLADTGWTFSPIRNRTWCFMVEKEIEIDVDLDTRIWRPLSKNIEALCGESNSKLLYLLGRDSLRVL
jgi:hypothetical protein